MGGLLSRLQAVKQQRGQNFWEFFPTLGNDFIAEQLERQKAQKQPSNGANCERRETYAPGLYAAPGP